MDVATQLTEHLQALSRHTDSDDLSQIRNIAAGLASLTRDLVTRSRPA